MKHNILSDKEVKKSCRTSIETDQNATTLLSTIVTSTWYLEPKRFSSWSRLTRIQAWVYRFLDNCRMPTDMRISGELMPEEIEDAEIQIIKKAQREVFQDEYLALSRGTELPRNSKLLRLNPKLDKDGIVLSDGRLKYAEVLPFNVAFRSSWHENIG